ncbi:integrator complex subunit 2 isoform X1 [Lethenteron reissneri]|uniref:integrator complex subunit 2 isoform X1 n=2 Tax=Lethenteron reissneri TaxID=7753 RepID=UPI002AB7E019|nr:integrator complex subunit 2 isoform X1 [Lethenteron reissneri]
MLDRAMLSSELPYPSPRAFEAMVCVDTAALSELPRADLRLLLPCLVRMALCAAADQSVAWAARKRHVLRLLSAVEPVNAVVALLSVDFHALEQEARRELHARRKSGAAGESAPGAAAAAATAAHGLALEFEHSDPTRRLHLVLSELLSLITRASGNNAEASGDGAGGAAGGSSAAAGRDASSSSSSSSSLSRGCELFECDVYLQEVADVLSILLAELPALLPMAEVAEALLLARHGAWFLCLLVANTPDCFTQVCRGLIHGGGSQDDDSPSGRRRVEALRQLCRMKPSQALNVRAMAVEACRLPSLAVALTLDQASEGPGAPEGVGARGPGDLVSFVSGLLLGSDARVRNWFTAFVKAGQQKRKGSLRGSLLAQMRQHLLSELHSILPHGNRLHGDRPHHGDRDPEPGGGTPSEGVAGEAAMEVDEGAGLGGGASAEGAGLGGGASAEGAGLGGGALAEEEVVRGGALLRLYCALMGIAGLRPSEEEVSRLLALITSRPPATAAGVRFVSLSLATLLAFTALVSTPRQEQIAVSWLNWMIREEAYFESKSGVAASFGEVLLLVAMYFHSNQLNSIVDLVCSTLGMKIPMKQNSLAKMKIIFTQDVFTEQVVTAHAVRVPVTPGLNAAMSGFLPVHCTYQLLRGRAFTKHKVPIKDWILAQVCESRLPLHSQLLPLLDAFITSVFTPASKANPELINQPMSEHSLLVAFQQQDASVSAQLLILYYILSYEEAFLTHARTLATQVRRPRPYSPALLDQIPVKFLIGQAQRLQQQIGALYPSLLRLVATSQPDLCLVEDWLLEEAAAGTQALLLRGLLLPARPATITPAALTRAFARLRSSPCALARALERLSLAPTEQLLALAPALARGLRCLLPPRTPQRLTRLAARIWAALNTATPRRLWVLTVNALQAPGCLPRRQHTELDLVLDPLIVLRCDARVFRCPPLLEVVLRVLAGSLAASRAFLASQMRAGWEPDAPSRGGPPGAPPAPPGAAPPAGPPGGPATSSANGGGGGDVTREELKNALLAAQDSAAVQILLEICLPELDRAAASSSSPPSGISTDSLLGALRRRDPSGASTTVRPGRLSPGLDAEWGSLDDDDGDDNDNDDDDGSGSEEGGGGGGGKEEGEEEGGGSAARSRRQEVQGLVCSFLHQMFIADPNIAKLVHFQGYPSELLHVTVAGIPSMHICLDFLPELLSQPQLHKQLFALQLAARLSLHFPLPKSMAVARLALASMSALLGVLPGERRASFLVPALPCVASLCRAFPSLYEDAVALLSQAGHACGVNARAQRHAVPSRTRGLDRGVEEEEEAMEEVGGGEGSGRGSDLASLLEATFQQLVQTALIGGGQ